MCFLCSITQLRLAGSFILDDGEFEDACGRYIGLKYERGVSLCVSNALEPPLPRYCTESHD